MAVAVLCADASLAGQPPTELFTDTTEVRVVHLDVLVLDRGGSPVGDLRREDFLVREDGEPVEIDFFDRPVGLDSGGTSEALPQEGSLADMAAPASGPLEWIVFVDDLRLDGGARKRVLRDLETLFASWEGNVLLRLVIQRDNEVIERGPFRDPGEMVSALADRPKGLVRGVISKIARRQTMAQLEGVREACALSGRDLCNDCWGEQLAVATRHAVDEVERVQVTALHLKNLLTRFDASAGRRSLLYVGDGLPLLAGAAVLWSLGDLCSGRRSEIEGEVARYRLNQVFEEVGALANAQRVAFHLLDAGGLRSPSFGVTSGNDSEHFRNLQAGLLTLAEQTGGKAILNANRSIDPVRASVREEVARYELGYTLARPPTGRVHRVQIELVGEAARGRTLRYRQTFWDRTSQMRLLQAMVATAAGGLASSADAAAQAPTNEGSRLALRLAKPDSRGVDPAGTTESIEPGGDGRRGRRRRVLLQIAISDQLAVAVPVNDGELRGSAVLAVLATDPTGRTGEPRTQQLQLGRGGLRAEQGWYFVDLALEVKRGQSVFVVGVRDEVSGQVETARLAVEIP